MNARRVETPHYTREQIAGHLTDSDALLREHGYVPAEWPALHVAVFNKLAEKSITVEYIEIQPGALALPRGAGGL